MNRIPWNKGIPESEEAKQKYRKTMLEKYKNGYISPRKGKHISDEHKKIISLANRNKIVSEETRQKMSANNKRRWVDCIIDKNKFAKKISSSLKLLYKNKENHPMYGKHHSEETKRRIREGVIKNNVWIGRHHTEETKQKMSKWHKQNKIITEETREKMRINNKGKNNPMFGRICCHGKREFYKGYGMRSSWEVIYAKWLDRNNYHWTYEPKRFFFEGKDFSYLPDFWVDEFNSYVEIKGFFKKEEEKEKINLFTKQNPLILIRNIKSYKEVRG